MKTPEFSRYAELQHVGERTGLGGNVLSCLDRLTIELSVGQPWGESLRHLTKHMGADRESSSHFTEEESRLSDGTRDLPEVTLLVSGGSSA